MPMTWSEWSALCPNGEMVDHPEVLALAEALRRSPVVWAWCESDGPPGLRASAHIAFAALLRLRARYASFSHGMGCRVPAGQALDDELRVPGLYDSLQAAGLVESVNLSAGTAIIKSRSCQDLADHPEQWSRDRARAARSKAIADALERMER